MRKPSIISQYANCLLSAAFLFVFGLPAFLAGEARAADDEVVHMVVELLKDTDDDMRMLALQQIRESVPGEDATKRFVAVLPELPHDVQIRLIDALGERGDPAARPVILKMLNSESMAMRVMAARTLSDVADPSDVSLLAKIAATGSVQEKEAARYSLRQLRGKKMDAAMTKALEEVETEPRIELIAALVDRNVSESLPVVIKSAADPDLAVRLAVLEALRAMAAENHIEVIVKRLKAAEEEPERQQAALALRTACSRGQTECAETVVSGFDGADAEIRILLMHALAEAGGPKALNEIVARLEDVDADVRAEALRVLFDWPDRSATVHLMELARDSENLKNHILAMRGLVRLARPGVNRPADLALLSEVMTLATRKEEKVLVLGTLGTIPTPESLALVAAHLDQPALVEDAGLVAVLIAEKIGEGNQDQVRFVMQKVVRSVQNEEIREGAKKVLEGL